MIAISKRRDHARELAAAAVAQGSRLVLAWGGDGTANEVAQALVQTPAALGIIPSGSGNGFARELNVNRRPAQAIRDALTAVPRRIDVGEIDGRIFVSIAGVGFDAHIASQFDRPGTRRGFAGYVRVTAKELWSYQCVRYRVGFAPQPPAAGAAPGIATVSGAGPRARSALLIAFANAAQFGNGARIAPGAKLDDGLLNMVVFEEVSRLATVWGLPRLFTGSVERVRGVEMHPIERASVEADAPMIFHVDGEPVRGGTRLDVRVRPAALLVVGGR